MLKDALIDHDLAH
ncbi:hypothetical protein AZE42_11992, partial [Rhizopogon vesiculosus]